MTTFVDYAWWTPTPAQLRSMGISGAMRYGVPRNSKSISPTECANLRAAGFDIGLVYETVADRAGQGPEAGREDSAKANAFADSLGYPPTCTLWYAVDFDASPLQVQPYFDGIASLKQRTHAPYGGFRVIEGVSYPGMGWQTVAWSAGKVSKRAGLLQNGLNGFHGTYDSNRVIVEDFGQWLAHPVPPVSQDEDFPPGLYVRS